MPNLHSTQQDLLFKSSSPSESLASVASPADLVLIRAELVEAGLLDKINIQSFLKIAPRYEKALAAILLAGVAGVAGTKLYKAYYKMFGKYVAAQTQKLLRLMLIQYLTQLKKASEEAKPNDPAKLSRGAIRSINALIKNLRDPKRPIAYILKKFKPLDTQTKLYTKLIKLYQAIEKTQGDAEKQTKAIINAANFIAKNYNKLALNPQIKTKLLPIIGIIKVKNNFASLLSFLPKKIQPLFDKLLSSSDKAADKVEKAKTLEDAFKTLSNLKVAGKIPYGKVSDGSAVLMEIEADVLPDTLGEVVVLSPQAYADMLSPKKKLTESQIERLVADVSARIALVDDLEKAMRKELESVGAKDVTIRYRIIGPDSIDDYSTTFATAKPTKNLVNKIVNTYKDVIHVQKEIANSFKVGTKAYALNPKDGHWYEGKVRRVTTNGLIIFKPDKRGVKQFEVDPVADEILKPAEYHEKVRNGEIEEFIPTLSPEAKEELEKQPTPEEEDDLLKFLEEEEAYTRKKEQERQSVSIDDLLSDLEI